ncbi:Guanine nucleotide exchange factor LTE1 [Meyerozyma sp. JA9]|nr:Guanine nucleotide exchange factor LTE1 [Meyerozyma sp. JA9]
MSKSVFEEEDGRLSAGDATSIFTPDEDVQAKTSESSHDQVQVPGSFELEEPVIEPTKTDDQFAYNYNNHNESIFDDEQFFPSLSAVNSSKVAKFDENNPQVLNHATVKALIVHLTSPDVIDYSFVCDFFLTYRTFSDSHEVMELLFTRLIWSLQYINANDSSKHDTGRLVLLRTFVVLRHWLLNYFVDDFNNDPHLCDYFVKGLNSVALESNLLKPNMYFELKIVRDIKVHWLSLINELWGAGIDIDSIHDMTTFYLPLTSDFHSRKISKSNTELSIHTNPSYRRSAMLSLYDQKFHKCLIVDENTAGSENPQFSVNTLLLQHQSSRVSINDKVRQLQAQSSLPAQRKPLQKTTRHNHMTLKDSSVGLKKTSAPNESADTTIQSAHTYNQDGFSTNGQVKLPTSRVNFILPPTPVKKMDYVIKDLESPTKKRPQPPRAEDDEFGRRSSMKKIVDGWKKSFIHHDSKMEPLEAGERIAKKEDVQEASVGLRSDILSARIVDELEYLIRFYVYNDPARETILEGEIEDTNDEKGQSSGSAFVENFESDSEKDGFQFGTLGSPAKQLPPLPSDELTSVPNDTASSNNMDINDISSLNITKIDNLLNYEEYEDNPTPEFRSTDPSFQRPTSINWNDEVNLDLEESTSISALKNMSQRDTSPLPEPNKELTRSSGSSMSAFSNITQYKAEVADLGIALSPRGRVDSVRRISMNENRRRVSMYSRGSSARRMSSRGSGKSYLSYDSAFSISNGNSKEDEYGNLRRMEGFNNLRAVGIPKTNEERRANVASFASFLSRSSSLRKSIRMSTLCALTELPFQDAEASESSINLVQKQNKPVSVISDSSIFSMQGRSGGNEYTSELKTENGHSESSTNSVAIPGISNYVLKELAAIPDESMNNNPVTFALRKLEGDNTPKGKNPVASVNASADVSADISYAENTEDILEQINNADTRDVIEVSTMSEVTQEPPLTPAKKSSAKRQTITPHTFMPSSNSSPQTISPKDILEAYTFSNEVLAVENVLNANLHVSFVLNFDSKTVAEHFTFIESDMLKDIDWKELIELKWSQELTPVNSWLEIIVDEMYYNKNKGVNLVISRFNLMVNWVISEILLTKAQSERIHLISRFIHIAQHCYAMQNYASMMQILLALTSEKIGHLKQTWKNLSPGDILSLKNLEELTSPSKNFLNLRLSINQIKPSKGCIPFVGLYLSDLIFNAERPATIKGGSEEKMINFSRFRTSVYIVKSLSQCIEWSDNYKIDVDDDLLSKCLYIRSLDEDEMNTCLNHIEDE